MKECAINNDTPIPTHDEATAVADPREGTFNCPSSLVTAQFSAVMILFFLVVISIRADQLNATFSQSLPQWIAVIAFIGNQALRILLGSPPSTTRNRNRIQRLFEEFDFARARRVQVVPQRNSLAVNHHHPLRALAPLGWPDACAPFFAGAKLPSTNDSLQSSWPRSSSSAKKARQALTQTSCSSQSLNRRQQVDALAYCFGNSDHGAPVRKTQRIPSNTFRLFTQGRPPFRFTLGLGKNGSTLSHCSSVNFQRVLAMGLFSFPWLFLHKFIRRNMLNY